MSAESWKSGLEEWVASEQHNRDMDRQIALKMNSEAKKRERLKDYETLYAPRTEYLYSGPALQMFNDAALIISSVHQDAKVVIHKPTLENPGTIPAIELRWDHREEDKDTTAYKSVECRVEMQNGEVAGLSIIGSSRRFRRSIPNTGEAIGESLLEAIQYPRTMVQTTVPRSI